MSRSVIPSDPFPSTTHFSRRWATAVGTFPHRSGPATTRHVPPGVCGTRRHTLRNRSPARRSSEPRSRYDRYEPGPHHLAFHAASDADVERVHQAIGGGGEVLDAPRNYGGEAGYGDYYYAAFFADPDGVKLEVCHVPSANP
jgi:catechol 2,3-dioxygenase-like lactoylglutathione lyase family enzyme